MAEPIGQTSHFKNLERFLAGHSKAVFWLTLGACFLLILSRRPDLITHPRFWAEDGTYWYADVYNHGFRSLFYLYDGYIVLLYHLVALLSRSLPLRLAPLFFNIVAICAQLLPLVLINSSRLRRVIPYRSLAILISFLYVSVLNANEVFGNLTNIQWHLGIASFLLLIATAGKSRWWRVFDVGVLLATGLSGPLLIILWPIAAFLWWRKRTPQHQWNLALVTGLALLQLIAIFFLSSYHRVGGQPDASLKYLAEMIVGQIFLGGLLGQRHVNMLYNHPLELVVALGVGLGLIIFAVWRGPLWLKLLNFFSLSLFVSMLASLKPVPGLNVWWGLANPGGGQRYWYIPMLIWIMTLLWLLLASRQKFVSIPAGFLLALLLVVGIPGSWRMAAPPDRHFQAYARHFQALPPGTKYSIPSNPPGWNMVLYKK